MQLKKENKFVIGGLLVIFFVSLFLRVYFLKNNALTFGYDQARDAINSQKIIQGDLKIQGPPSSTPGIYHGVLWYYFLTIPHLVSNNPIYSAIFLSIFSSLNVFIVYYLGLLLTKNYKIGMLSALLFAISFESSQYAVWLSNPTLAIVFVPLIYLFLWKFITEDKNKKYSFWIGIFLGLSAQSEVFLAYHLIPILFWFAVSTTKQKFNKFVLFIYGLLVSIFSLLVSEFKFGFKSINGFLSLLSKGSITTSESLGDVFVRFLNQLGRVYAYNFYPNNLALGGGLVIVFMFIALFGWEKRKNFISWQPFLIIWMLSHVTVVAIGGDSTPFLLVGIGPAISIFLSIFIYKTSHKKYYYIGLVFLFLTIYGNISSILKENSRAQTIFSIQKDMTLANQIQVIDYTYQASNQEMFSINSVTSPLWINIVWTYLYKNFGNDKYGYLPFWHGRDQIGQLDSLEYLNNKDVKYYYLIIEPLAGIPKRFADEEVESENSKYQLLEEKRFGEIMVQKRIKNYE